MNLFANPSVVSFGLAAGLFAGILLCLEFGYRAGRRASEEHPDSSHEGIGVIEAAVFGLLGLLLGFSFSGGTSRLDARRGLIVQEANAIGTAYLRLDLLPAAHQPEMRRLFRDYVDARIRMYRVLPDMISADQEMARSAQLQQQIWSKAMEGANDDPTREAVRLLLPALNEMIDVTTSRQVALHTRVPALIFALLVVVALLSGLLAGYAMAKRQRRSRFHALLFAGVVAVTVYVVMDLDNPTVGLIRLEQAERALVQLRDSMR